MEAEDEAGQGYFRYSGNKSDRSLYGKLDLGYKKPQGLTDSTELRDDVRVHDYYGPHKKPQRHRAETSESAEGCEGHTEGNWYGLDAECTHAS